MSRMRTLLTRTFYGLIFASLMIGAILGGMRVLMAFMLLVAILGTEESLKLFSSLKLKPSDKNLVRFFSFLFFLIASFVATQMLPLKALSLLPLLLLMPMVHALFSKRHPLNEVGTIHWFNLLFVVCPSVLMLFFYDETIVGPLAGGPLLLGIIVAIWVNDTFAYLVGTQFGRHRLFKRVSPKKSWEGSLGGLLFTLLGAGLFAHFSQHIALHHALILAFIIVLTGSIGDLIESALKRQANMKDSGKVIPGHGGILDRFDATFFAIPFVFVYLFLTH